MGGNVYPAIKYASSPNIEMSKEEKIVQLHTSLGKMQVQINGTEIKRINTKHHP